MNSLEKEQKKRGKRQTGQIKILNLFLVTKQQNFKTNISAENYFSNIKSENLLLNFMQIKPVFVLKRMEKMHSQLQNHF